MERTRRLLEQSAFGVCTYLADRMGLHRRRVRLYFIYISCLTLGSPVLLYLFTAFWLNIKRYLAEGKKWVISK